MVAKKKLKTKKWVKIVAPKMFNECELGESLVMEPKSLIGRVITVPLSTLIGDFSKQHMLLSFKIDDVRENIAQTSVKNFNVSKSHIIRRTRRRSTKADSVETITIKDNKKAIIKTVVITPFKTQKFQKRSLLVALRENLENMCKNYNFEALILALCSNKLQADLQTKLKKVYPVKYLEIRSLEMVKK